MINKKRFKKFQQSEYSSSIKKFAISFISNNYYPSSKRHNLLFISDLNLLEESKLDKPNEYYIIDFTYLNTLPSDIIDHWLEKIGNFMILNNRSNDVKFLHDSGIFLSNIEYLKILRERKLKKVKEKENSVGFNNDLDLLELSDMDCLFGFD